MSGTLAGEGPDPIIAPPTKGMIANGSVPAPAPAADTTPSSGLAGDGPDPLPAAPTRGMVANGIFQKAHPPPMPTPIGWAEGIPIFDESTPEGRAAGEEMRDANVRMGEKIGEGATFRLFPHIAAGARFVTNEIMHPTPADQPYAKPYSAYLQEQRDYTNETSKRYPEASMIAEGAGMAPLAMATGGGGAVTAAAERALVPTLGKLAPAASRLLWNTGVGTVMGGASAAGNDIGQGTYESLPGDIGTGALIGGGFGAGGSLLAEATHALVNAGRGIWNWAGGKGWGIREPVVDPNTGSSVRATPQQQQAAVEKVETAAGGPAQLQSDLAKPDSAIPGYNRTLAQQTENPGIVSLDTKYRTGKGGYGPEMDAYSHQQGAQLQGQLSHPRTPGVDRAPPEGDPYSVGRFFTARLNALEADQANAAAPAAARVQQAQTDLGPATTAAQSGETMQGAIGDVQATRQATADQQVAQATAARNEAVAATPPGRQSVPGGPTAQEQLGAEARSQNVAARQAAKEQENRLWQSINPDGTAGAQSTGFKQGVNSIYADLPESAKPPAGEEAAIRQVVNGWGDIVPLSEVQALRSRINDAIASEVESAGQTQTAVSRRLIQVKGQLDQALEDTLNAHGAREGAAVQAGQMAPEATLESRLRQQWGLEQAPPQPSLRPMTADELQRAREANAFSQRRARTFDEGTMGEIGAPGENRTAAAVPGDRGFKVADPDVMNRIWNGKDTEAANLRQAQDAGITAETLKAHAADDLRRTAIDENGNFDLAKYAQWRREHAAGLHIFPEVQASFDGAARAQETLAARQAEATAVTQANPLRNVTHPSEVPGRYVVSGDTGADMARQFVRDSGGDRTALQAFDDSIVRKMRETEGLLKPDGTLDAAKLGKFQRDYAGALSERPDLAAKLGDVNTAQAEFDRVAGEHAARVAEFQNGAAKNWLQDDPHHAIGKALNSSNPVESMRALMEQVRGSQDATMGVRRATVDYMLNQFSSTRPASSEAEFLKSAQFQNWLRTRRDALKVVFGGQGVQNIDRVAAELRRAGQIAETAKGSPTTQRLFSEGGPARREGDHGNGVSAYALLAGESIGEVFGHTKLGMATAIVAKPLINGIRQAGLQTKDDLVKMMLLSPELTRELSARVDLSRGIPPLQVRRIVTLLSRVAGADTVLANQSTSPGTPQPSTP